MPVLERDELEASPLADLHTIANQLGIDGFRRLRKADLVDAILGVPADGRDAEIRDRDGGGRRAGPRITGAHGARTRWSGAHGQGRRGRGRGRGRARD